MDAEFIDVMHIVDTLDVGGAERVAVNLVNLLPRDRYRPHLCTTRREGALADLVVGDVGRLRLGRTRTLDASALWRLVRYARAHRVRILHAHGTALLSAVAASRLLPSSAVVWHDHYGRHGVEARPEWVYRRLTSRADAVIAVTPELAEWARSRLGVHPDRVRYLPNFVTDPGDVTTPVDLPGEPGSRVVCVANLRPQKDHSTLLKAMAYVVERIPGAHLLLVGTGSDVAYRDSLATEVGRLRLGANVSFLGRRLDVPAILRCCDVGVLSSSSEGLPLSLIEYGMAGLPVAVTHVGQCPEVVEHGRAGVLVRPGEPDALGTAITDLLASPARRSELSRTLRTRVEQQYGAAAILQQVTAVYDEILSARMVR